MSFFRKLLCKFHVKQTVTLISEQEALNLVLELLNGAGDGTLLVGENGHGDDVSGDATGSSKISLLSDIDIRHVLVFAEKWKMQDNL